MLWMFQRVFFEKTNERTEKFKDLSLVETLTFLPVILLIIFMGIYPQPFLEKIEPAAQRHVAKFSSMPETHVVDTIVPTAGLNHQKN